MVRKKTMGYIRYSTEGQAEDEHDSPEIQKLRIRRECESHSNPSWPLDGFYQDDAKSGDDITRDGFWQMLDDVATGKVERIVVAYRDRLMRDKDLLSLVVRYFAVFKTQIWFSDMGMGITGNESGEQAYSLRMLLDSLGGMNEMMLRIIRVKTKDALEYKKEMQHIKLGRRVAGFESPDKKSMVPGKQLLKMEGLEAAGESPESIATMGFVVEGGKHAGEPLTARRIKRRLRNLRNYREGTLEENVGRRTKAMLGRREELQRAKAENAKKLEAKLRARLPAEIRNTRL